ncbi:DNA polymerase I [Bacteroidia bacterium]|nr:DNA polymerase I [Bacteroidia bacterium]
MKKLFLLDAFALIYRSYFAYARNPLRNSKGFDTSVIYGFVQTLREVLHKEQPTHIGVAFDVGGETFRHLMLPSYKANRKEQPDVIRQSVPIIEEMLSAFHIPVYKRQGYEADDVIGTLAKKAEQAGFTVYMMTPDKDYGQLVSDNILIHRPARFSQPTEKFGRAEICKKYEITDPLQVIDILALWGDSSDNVPGAPGVGEKGAIKLISQYGSIENLIAHAHELTGKLRQNIEQNAAQIKRAKELVTIDLDVPVDFDEEELKLKEPDKDLLREIFTDLEFKNFLRDICGETAASIVNAQPTLFAEPAATLFDLPATAGKTTAAAQEQHPHLTIADVPHTYRCLQNIDEITELANLLQQQKQFCFDTETDNIDPINAHLVGISFAIEPHNAYYIPLNVPQEQQSSILALLRTAIENKGIAKIGQNIKFDYLVLKNYGIKVAGDLLDTMLMHYLIEPEQAHNMDALSENYLDYTPISIENLIGKKGLSQGNMKDVAIDKIAEYAAEDADVTLQLFQKLQPILVQNGLEELYKTVEAPLIQVLGDMEYEGVCIDSNALSALSSEMNADLNRLEAEIRTMASEPELNVFSPKQLGEVLFDKLKIVENARTTSKSKQYSTSEETLTSLKNKHPIVPKILEIRSVKKLLSAYIESLPNLVNPSTGRIHTSFNQAVTSTGRLSSNNPNLQNIPIREAEGRKIRATFIPSDAHHVLLSADYSQIELRLMAHLSDDENLMQAFFNNEDVHTATAAKIFHINLSQVTPEQRRQAKTANFGIIYGISAFGLSQRLDIPRGEARLLIDGYFEAYPKVRAYMDNIVQTAREHKYVTTICGRQRMLPNIDSRSAMDRGYAERNAINAPIQGSASDIIKLAMIKIGEQLQQEKLRTKMILQVHDELVFDVPNDELEAVKRLVKNAMENSYTLRVPLIAEMGTGHNWLEAH